MAQDILGYFRQYHGLGYFGDTFGNIMAQDILGYFWQYHGLGYFGTSMVQGYKRRQSGEQLFSKSTLVDGSIKLVLSCNFPLVCSRSITMARHHGEKTTKVVIGKTFYQPKMKQDVKHFVHTCVKCQSTKFIYKMKYGLCRPLPIPSEPWESVSMDFMTQLPKWNGMYTIFVVIIQFCKLAKMAPITTIATTFDSAKLFFNMWVRHHGLPQFIISDRDVKFTTGFLKHLFQKVTMKLLFNMAFHPQINGQIERVNGVLSQ